MTALSAVTSSVALKTDEHGDEDQLVRDRRGSALAREPPAVVGDVAIGVEAVERVVEGADRQGALDPTGFAFEERCRPRPQGRQRRPRPLERLHVGVEPPAGDPGDRRPRCPELVVAVQVGEEVVGRQRGDLLDLVREGRGGARRPGEQAVGHERGAAEIPASGFDIAQAAPQDSTADASCTGESLGGDQPRVDLWYTATDIVSSDGTPLETDGRRGTIVQSDTPRSCRAELVRAPGTVVVEVYRVDDPCGVVEQIARLLVPRLPQAG